MSTWIPLLNFSDHLPPPVPKALHDKSGSGEPLSSGGRATRKRTRESNAVAASTESVNDVTSDAEEPTLSKRYRISVVSDYNTRFKADRRGRLSDPGPGRRRRFLSGPAATAAAGGTSISSLVARTPVRASRRKRQSAVAASSGSGVTGSRRRVILGEPVSSETPDEEEERMGPSISRRRRRRRRTLGPRVRAEEEEEEEEEESPAKKRRIVVRGKRTIRVNGAREDGDEAEQVKRGPKTPTIKRGRGRPRKNPMTPESKSNGRRKSTGKTRPRSGSRAKMVFDGIDVPPVSKAISVAMKKREMVLGDEDADGEVDEEAHQRAEEGEGQHSEGEGEGKGKERALTTEHEEDGMAADQPTLAGEEEYDDDEIGGPILDDISSLGNSNKG